MEEFQEIMNTNLGIKLTEVELQGLLNRYQPDKDNNNQLNSDKILNDIKDHINKAQLELRNYNPSDEIAEKDLSYKDILSLILNKISFKAANFKGDNQYQKAFIILGNNRAAELTPSELKAALQYRLALKLNDHNIDALFRHLDHKKTGFIKIRKLVNEIIKCDPTVFHVSLEMNTSNETINETKQKISKTFEVTTRSYINPTAYVDYKNNVKNLDAPDPSTCVSYTVDRLEESIREKVIEKAINGKTMLQSLVHLFGDDRESRIQQRVTLNQIKYTIWKRFQFRVKESDILALYNKYDPNNIGYIPFERFAHGVIKMRSINEPLIDDYTEAKHDTSFGKTTLYDENIRKFLIYMRGILKDRELKVPNYLYLIQSINRMTMDQAKDFFENKLFTRVETPLLLNIQTQFNSNGLIDMRKLIYTAMNVNDYGLIDKSTNINKIVTNDNPDLNKYNIRDIETLITEKINEKLSNDSLLQVSTIQSLLQDTGHGSTIINKSGLKNILKKLKINISSDDIEKLFSKYDRGDGLIHTSAIANHLSTLKSSNQNSNIIPQLDISSLNINKPSTLSIEEKQSNQNNDQSNLTKRPNTVENISTNSNVETGSNFTYDSNNEKLDTWRSALTAYTPDNSISQSLNNSVKFSPMRPISAPPSKSRAKSVNNTSITFDTKYVNTGVVRSHDINPLNSLLKYKYKMSRGNTVTSNEDYGLFLRSLQREQKIQNKLKVKYENIKNEIKNETMKDKNNDKILDLDEITAFTEKKMKSPRSLRIKESGKVWK